MGLRVENLKVYYRTVRGDVKALDGATFEVADGEIMGLGRRVGLRQVHAVEEPDPPGQPDEARGRTVELDGKTLPLTDHERDEQVQVRARCR